MMEKSCGWWLIWYLLFFCHGGAEGQLQWIVKEKVTAYGQNLILFCPVENCCSEPAGWFVGSKTIIVDVKTFSNDLKVKYHGTYTKDGFGVVIRNLSEADLNVTYRCVYGFDQSTPKYLLDGDVFRENVPDKEKENDTAAIVLPIVVIMVGFVIGIGYCVYRSQIKKKRQKQTDETKALSNNENNFCCYYYLCHDIATKAVRSLLERKVHEVGLESFLNKYRSSLTNKNRYIKEQNEKLFLGGQVVSADSDFNLLYELLRNLFGASPAATRGLCIDPSYPYLNDEENLEKILIFRKELANTSFFEIDDKMFSTKWDNLAQAIDRLSKGSLLTDVESMRTKRFDKTMKNEMEDDIRKEKNKMQKEVVTECKTDIADNRQNIADNRPEILNINTKHIPSNIRKAHIELIRKWRIEEQLFYDETGGFTAVLDMVKSKNYMTIIGGPGSGKTATARHIALQLEDKGWEVVPVCRLEDIIQYGDRDYKQVFVLDDVLGIFGVERNICNDISSLKEKMFTTIGETSKLLLTCRKSLYKEAFALGLFVTENVVDLQSKDNQLTKTEKKVICQYHCQAKNVNPDLYTSLSFTKANYMFPFLCKLFSMEEQYQRLGESFFNTPFGYFISELDKLQHANTIQYAVLVLCLINESKLSVDSLPHKSMQEVFNNCRLNRNTSDEKIKDAIYHMSETYFTKLDTKYTFTHDFIFEAIAYHYGRQNENQQQQHILKYLSSSYIANKVTVYEQASNEDLCIHLSEDMYLPLAERLYTDIQSMNLFDVFMNKSLKHGPFLDVFKGMLRTKPYDEFESLILMKCQNIHRFMNTTFSGKEPVQQMFDIIEIDRLHVLFGTIHRTVCDSEHTCNVRVISWIINYGHTHLLQEIVNHVEYNNHSTSLIFGSDVMENTRLLLLGCYSNTLDMVELILKYVDPKCIDIDFPLASLITRNITPLIAGCMIGKLSIVKALLRNHADINNCNNRNTSPLITALNHGHIYVVECLLNSGADINWCDDNGQSPLYVASMSGHCDVVKCLLRYGADINLCDNLGQTPLFVASIFQHFDVVKFLQSFDEDINDPDEDG